MMKNLKYEKIVGYFLLIIGLCIIIYSIVSVIGTFNDGKVPIEILNSENKEINQNNGSNQSLNLGDVITPLFPMLNALIWLAIALFLVAAGGRVAIIGINMMKVSIPNEVKIIRFTENNNIKTEKNQINDDISTKT